MKYLGGVLLLIYAATTSSVGTASPTKSAVTCLPACAPRQADPFVAHRFHGGK